MLLRLQCPRYPLLLSETNSCLSSPNLSFFLSFVIIFGFWSLYYRTRDVGNAFLFSANEFLHHLSLAQYMVVKKNHIYVFLFYRKRMARRWSIFTYFLRYQFFLQLSNFMVDLFHFYRNPRPTLHPLLHPIRWFIFRITKFLLYIYLRSSRPV